MADAEWYAVRCIFASPENKPWGPHDLPEGEIDYEERITLWQSATAEEAIALAEADAAEYAEILECEYTGLAQSYWLPEPPGHGQEVFSLIRRSALEQDDYVDQLFSTGTEHERHLED